MIDLEVLEHDLLDIVGHFFSQGQAPVYIAVGQGRLYVGEGPAQAFADSPEIPHNHPVSTTEDVERLLRDPVFVRQLGG